MNKVNDYIVYKKEVCKIKEIKENKTINKKYYVLAPVSDDSLKLEIPITEKMDCLRKVISKDNAIKLINNIPSIKPIENIDDKYIENTYKDLLMEGTYENLIKIIKTTYLRNDLRLKNKRKISEKDYNYFSQAENYLYNELAIALNMTYDETKEYIINKVQELTQDNK